MPDVAWVQMSAKINKFLIQRTWVQMSAKINKFLIQRTWVYPNGQFKRVDEEAQKSPSGHIYCYYLVYIPKMYNY